MPATLSGPFDTAQLPRIAPQPVTVTISRAIRPGLEAQYLVWAEAAVATCARSTGVSAPASCSPVPTTVGTRSCSGSWTGCTCAGGSARPSVPTWSLRPRSCWRSGSPAPWGGGLVRPAQPGGAGRGFLVWSPRWPGRTPGHGASGAGAANRRVAHGRARGHLVGADHGDRAPRSAPADPPAQPPPALIGAARTSRTRLVRTGRAGIVSDASGL